MIQTTSKIAEGLKQFALEMGIPFLEHSNDTVAGIHFHNIELDDFIVIDINRENNDGVWKNDLYFMGDRNKHGIRSAILYDVIHTIISIESTIQSIIDNVKLLIYPKVCGSVINDVDMNKIHESLCRFSGHIKHRPINNVLHSGSITVSEHMGLKQR